MIAVQNAGFEPVYCGTIPTQAVSLYGFSRKIPSIMVTGSHIPYDRNGIKFNLPEAEILKKDERAITKYYEKLTKAGESSYLFQKDGSLQKHGILPKINLKAGREYVDRYLGFLQPNILKGKKILVFQHSAVIRDMMVEIFEKLGAQVFKVGRSAEFIPIDTEAMRMIDLKNARAWARKCKADAICSADGDSDRPMLFDENGDFIRGDFLGVICSAYLKADSVSATASCTTALEKSGKFKKINRTKIGSPYVVEAMQKDEKRGYRRIVSYEANGGFLLQKTLSLHGRTLQSLPTRDSMLPILCALAYARENKLSLSDLVKKFPQRFVYSQSIKEFPTEKIQEMMGTFTKKNMSFSKKAKKLFGLPAEVKKFDFLDGARMFLKNGEIVHVRPSGNSPEIRVYCETESVSRSQEVAESILKKISW